MKKIKVKTSEVLVAYNVLNSAKYGSMEDADKIKVWKIARALKPVATKFEEDNKDAAEKFKPKDEDFDQKLQEAQEFERLRNTGGDMSKAKIGVAQYEEFIAKFKEYNTLVGKAVEEFAKKEVTVEFEALSEESFGKLMASNDWKISEVMAISEIICKDPEYKGAVNPKKADE